MKIALFTVEALPNARAVRQLVFDHSHEITYVGVSNTHRPQAGGLLGQLMAHITRSGYWMIPYLFVNFFLPDVVALLSPLIRRLVGDFGPRATPLKDLCAELGILFHTVDNVNDRSVVEHMKRTGIDMILSFHFDQIFKRKTIDSVPLGGINVHPALLPLHRGPFPTFHALLDDDPIFGVTVHKLAAKIDAGAILHQALLPLQPIVTATKASIQLFDEGRACVDRVLDQFHRTGHMLGGRVNVETKYCPWPSQIDMADFYSKGKRMVDLYDSLWP